MRQQIMLFAGELDSPEPPFCLLSLSNAEDDWKCLGDAARKELSKV